MKYIISVIAGFFALLAVVFAAVSTVRYRKVRRKPVMTFRELYRDNAASGFGFLFDENDD